MPDLKSAKRSLRGRMRVLRAAITDRELSEASKAVWNRLRGMPELVSSEAIHTYCGALPGEIRTDLPIKWALSHGRRVLVPCADMETLTMRHVILEDPSQLAPTAWGGVEPRGGREAEAVAVDVVIVPGVAFDRCGGRLGMGGGFYDRFLSGLAAPKIGLAHTFQLVDTVPVDDTDVPLDAIVTPDKMIRVQR